MMIDIKELKPGQQVMLSRGSNSEPVTVLEIPKRSRVRVVIRHTFRGKGYDPKTRRFVGRAYREFDEEGKVINWGWARCQNYEYGKIETVRIEKLHPCKS